MIKQEWSFCPWRENHEIILVVMESFHNLFSCNVGPWISNIACSWCAYAFAFNFLSYCWIFAFICFNREHAPSIIFMDEIDSIGSARMESGSGNGDSEVQRTMLELLNQLDGFEASNKIKVWFMDSLQMCTFMREAIAHSLLMVSKWDIKYFNDTFETGSHGDKSNWYSRSSSSQARTNWQKDWISKS